MSLQRFYVDNGSVDCEFAFDDRGDSRIIAVQWMDGAWSIEQVTLGMDSTILLVSTECAIWKRRYWEQALRDIYQFIVLED